MGFVENLMNEGVKPGESVKFAARTRTPRRTFDMNQIEPTPMVASSSKAGAVEYASPGNPGGDILSSYGLNTPKQSMGQQVAEGALSFAKAAIAGLKSFTDPDNGSFEGAIDQSLKDIDSWDNRRVAERNLSRGLKHDLIKNVATGGAYAKSFSQLGHAPDVLGADQNVLMENLKRFQQGTQFPDSTNSYYSAQTDPMLQSAIDREVADKQLLYSTMGYSRNAQQPSYGYGATQVWDPNTGQFVLVDRPSAKNLRSPEDLRVFQEKLRLNPQMAIPATEPAPTWGDRFNSMADWYMGR